MTARGPVVVGVDGTPASMRAVQWASEEAAARDVPLRIVHAIDPSDDAGTLPVGDSSSPSAVRRVLDDARAIAHLAAPELDVTAVAPVCEPVAALAEESSAAPIVCVGSAGESAAHPGHRIGLVTELLLASRCPVSVVRGSWPRTGAVVTVVGCGPYDGEVLRAAVAEAVLRSSRLRILVGSERVGVPAHTREETYECVSVDVDRLRREHPGLDVVALTPLWTSTDYLLRKKRDVALFVAPPRLTHDVGTVVHAEAAQALALLDCPVLFNAELGNTAMPITDTTERGVAS